MSVYAVWVPSLASDEESAVPAATKFLPDKRVRHFWDGKGELKQVYARVLQLNKPAWDVYLLSDHKVVWKDDPPVPQYWMHQLNLAPELRLDGDKLAAEVEKMLEQMK